MNDKDVGHGQARRPARMPTARRQTALPLPGAAAMIRSRPDASAPRIPAIPGDTVGGHGHGGGATKARADLTEASQQRAGREGFPL
jgi:hypothetical protein